MTAFAIIVLALVLGIAIRDAGVRIADAIAALRVRLATPQGEQQ
jgi:hypothetical protein